MGRTPLSDAQTVFGKWFFPGILLCFYVAALYQIWQGPAADPLEGIGFITLLVLCLFGISKWIGRRVATFGTAFDAEYLYLLHPDTPQQVPLALVYKIKLTMTQFGSASVYKIGYHDANGQPQALRILPTSGFYLDEFKEAVRQQNPRVEVINYSHSFDFDQ